MESSKPRKLNKTTAIIELRRREAERRHCAADPWYFLTHYVKTQVPGLGATTVPAWDYIKELVDGWQNPGTHVVLKSRQMMVSWIYTALALHEVLFVPAGTVLVVSKGEEYAKELKRRFDIIRGELPKWLYDEKSIDTDNTTTFETGAPLFTKGKWLPASQDVGRTYSASRVIFDEMAFAMWAAEMYKGVRPTISDGRGGVFCISTPNGAQGEFHRLYQLAVDQSSSAMYAYKIHYSRHPLRQESWVTREKQSHTTDAWDQEYECSFLKVRGPVYPEFSYNIHVIDPFEIPASWDRYRVIDPGLRDPTACTWWAVDLDGVAYCYLAYKRAEVTIKEHCDAIKRLSGGEQYRVTWIDPAAHQRSKLTATSEIDEFRKYGIPVVTCSNQYTASVESVRSRMLRDGPDGKPMIMFFRGVSKDLYDEIPNIRYREPNQTTGETAEMEIHVDNHCSSTMRYFCLMKPKGTRAPVSVLPADSVGRYLQDVKRANKVRRMWTERHNSRRY